MFVSVFDRTPWVSGLTFAAFYMQIDAGVDIRKKRIVLRLSTQFILKLIN